MDAIHRETFERITRRNQYDVVYNNMIRLITEGFNVRINFIALDGQNTDDILPMLELTKHYNVSVRFLEEMPFNGGSKEFQTIKWDFKTILEHIKSAQPDYYKLESPKTSTSINYKIPGFKGTFGVIPSFSRTFCGSCNRLRISATGDVITCLYAKASANLRDIMRADDMEENIRKEILKAVGSRAKTGFEAQEKYKDVFSNSMTSIGG